MSLQTTLSFEADLFQQKITVSIDRLKTHEPKEGYYLAFSGGKDSIVLKHLAVLSGVKFDAHFSLTTVDPPEVVRFIKQYHSDVEIVKPQLSMWQLIQKNGCPPTRLLRYCCRELKEVGGEGRFVLTGIRAAESSRRAKRRVVESCSMSKSRTFLHPIIDWSDADVWQLIRYYELPYPSLYDEGWHRIGCIGCPMSGKDGRSRDFERWPKYKDAYLRAFDKVVKLRKLADKRCDWDTAQDLMDWWMSGGYGSSSKTDNDNTVLIFEDQ